MFVSQSVLLGYLVNEFADTEICVNNVGANTTESGRQSISNTAYIYGAGKDTLIS